MSPSIHREDKYKFHFRAEPPYRELMEKLMKASGDADKTALLKRLLEEEAKRKGIK